MAIYNVVADYDWTSIPRKSNLRNKAPRVHISSYKLSGNQVLKRLVNYLSIAERTSAEDFYNNLYGGGDVEDHFHFPFFGDNIRSFNNSFGDTFQNGFGAGGGIGSALDDMAQTALSLTTQVRNSGLGKGVEDASNVFKNGGSLTDAVKAFGGGVVAGGEPGSYIETPKFYQYEPNDGPLEVSFVLSNTINDDYIKNYKLVNKLTKINRPYRHDSISMDPPRIFRLKLPGYRYIPWCYCSSFSVNLLGSKREINNIIIPEGYQITMSFTSLTVESGNFMEEFESAEDTKQGQQLIDLINNNNSETGSGPIFERPFIA